ncbi:MAG: hypothetical protein M5U07_09115 [Xanthobacteraceae bacterium]|nr:hypothetical protein [Xanthobacteraceae bacterium]
MSVGLRRERPFARIEGEPQLQGAVLADPARRQPVTVALPRAGEPALALHGPDQRAHLAREPQPLERELGAARRIAEQCPAVFDGHALDREPVRRESHGGAQPGEAAVLAEREPDLGRDDAQLGRAHIAAHQRAERGLEVELARRELRRAVRAEGDLRELQGRGRQDAQVDRARDPHRRPDQPARFRLEGGPIPGPVDEMRPRQRCHQRQDDRNAHSQQCCLHCALRGRSTRGCRRSATPGSAQAVS